MIPVRRRLRTAAGRLAAAGTFVESGPQLASDLPEEIRLSVA